MILDDIGKKVHTLFLKTLHETNDELLSVIFSRLESYWFDRDRTALIWFSNQIVGGVPEQTLGLSLIISLTSAGIGIHDDIIDKTRFKHGQHTVYGEFGKEKALIAGDFLLVKGLLATRLLSELESYPYLVQILDAYFQKMAEAELWEVSANKNLDIRLDDHLRRQWDLGLDGGICARLGAVVGNATVEEAQVLEFFGQTIGYVLRLREELKDILNINGGLVNRIRSESIPLGLVYISGKSRNYYATVSDILSKESVSAEDVAHIVEMCYDTDFPRYIEKKIEEKCVKALEELNIFPDSGSKDILRTILEIKRG